MLGRFHRCGSPEFERRRDWLSFLALATVAAATLAVLVFLCIILLLLLC